MKMYILLLVITLVALLSSCDANPETLQQLGLSNLTAKDILLGLEDGSIEPEGYAVSVYDDELLLLLDDDTISLPMPEDEFYLSVAPFKTLTHECLYHSATGCRGELKFETFDVKFVTQDGTVILSETMNSSSNGFLDLWLPRDIEGTLTITQGTFTTSKLISTASGQPTCETTMQLLEGTQNEVQ